MSKYSLVLEPPFMNAAGCLGFAPDLHGPVDLGRLGAFITNPISQGARSPASGVRCIQYPGGFLIHTGYPNPGFRVVLRRYAAHWGRSPLPVWVHLLAGGARRMAQMVRDLEGLPGVAGVEISLPPDARASSLHAILEASLGELPLIVRLPLERALEFGEEAIHAGASAVSLGAPRGALPLPDGGILHGRMYGQAIFPLALELVKSLAARGLPVIGAGGIYSQTDAEVMLQAGALAVQLDAALWSGY